MKTKKVSDLLQSIQNAEVKEAEYKKIVMEYQNRLASQKKGQYTKR